MAAKTTKTTKKKTAKKSTPKASKKTARPLEKDLISLLPELSEDELQFLISQAQTMIRNTELRAKMEERQKTSAADTEGRVEIIEGEDDGHFIILINNERNFFSRDEMRKIVALCHRAEDESAGGGALFSWFERFRSDVIRNSPLSGPGDPLVGKVFDLIISTYTVKE